MFNKILIANRGEIACRIIQTIRSLKIQSVAIYSTADQNARHVKLADEAYWIGASPSSESYLNIDNIIHAAKGAGVDAIHPGYGFLAENPDFASSCEKAHIRFIGPTAQSIATMGSKSHAKAIMHQAKVPILPDYYSEDQCVTSLLQAAKKLGFPLLLKPIAGGGGKGMRVIHSETEFEENLTAVQREAQASFDNKQVMLEKYLGQARHIEIQIAADRHGNVVCLFERDCSIQRRYQKIIEEAPALRLTQELRSKMGKAAIKAARAIDYEGVGTVEFLLDENENFYFMEMNTRLQVEHPVTEMITGIDLVAWQLIIAAGDKLPLAQQDISIKGHAIEVRIYAEIPEQQFLPATGKIIYLSQPKQNQHLRIDSGIKINDEISIYYDPLLAKIIAWDETRDMALQKLAQALQAYHLVGVKTNLKFLLDIIQHPSFEQCNFNTHFIETYQSELFQEKKLHPETIALASIFILLNQAKCYREQTQKTADPYSPWSSSDAWQMNLPAHQTIQYTYHNNVFSVEVIYKTNHYQLTLPDQSNLHASAILEGGCQIDATINGKKMQATVIEKNNTLTIFDCYGQRTLTRFDPLTNYREDSSQEQHLRAPMPATIVALFKQVGEKVKQGESLVILEAMKMEHTIQAPQDGIIEAIYFSIGDQVDEGVELINLNPKI